LPEAVEHYAKALELCQKSISGEQCEGLQHIFTRLGRAYELSNHYQEAANTYLQVEHLAQETNNQALRLSALIEHARLLSTPNPIFDALESDRLCNRALGLAQQLNDPASEARIHWIFVLALWLTNPRKAVEHGTRSLELARTHNLKEQMAYTLHDIHRAYIGVGNIQQARASLEEARSLWRALGNLPLLADNLASAADLAAGLANPIQALTLANEAHQISRAIGNLGIRLCQRMIGQVRTELGHVDEAIRALQESTRLALQAGVTILFGRVVNNLASLYLLLGAFSEIEEFLDWVDAGLDQLHEPADSSRRINLLAFRIRTALYRNDRYGAIKLLRKAEQLIAQPTMHFIQLTSAKIEVSLTQQYFDQASRLSNELIADASTIQQTYVLPEYYTLKGRALLGLGDLESATNTLLQAHELAKTRQSKIFLPSILSLLAQLAELRGEPAHAKDYMKQARQSVEYLLNYIATPNIRAAFLNQPEIQAILDKGAA
jgi:tetratricopeptide (TPR) repeat protein